MATGIVLSLLAAFLFATGNILEKRAVDGMRSFSLRHLGRSLRQVQRSPLWLLGAFASVFGSIVQIFAFHFVSISIVQSVSVAGVVLIVVASRLHFRETLTSGELVGLFICIVAFVATLISISGGGTKPGIRATNTSAILAIVGTLLATGIILTSKRLRIRSRDFVYGTSAGLMYGIVGLSNKGLSTEFSHSSKSGIFASVIASPYIYLMIVAWGLALALFQIGLQRGRMGIIVPLAGAVTAIYVATVGTPLFGETLPNGTLALALRVIGFAGILLGSVLLTLGGNREVIADHDNNSTNFN